MASQTQVLQAGVSADNFLVGPAVLLLQDVASYTATDPGDGTGQPRYINDIINITTGVAMTANGWAYYGYTENLAANHNRSVVQHDSDQEARVKTVHDTWERTITLTGLETTLAKIKDLLHGKSTDPSAVSGAPTAQQYVRIGNPTTIDHRRAAIIQVDDSGICWAYVYRKTDVRPTGGPTWTRTGRVEWAVELVAHPDTRVSDVDDRVLQVFRTNASIA